MSDYKFIDDIIDDNKFNNILSNEHIKYILLGFLIFIIICIFIYLFMYKNSGTYQDKLIVKQSLIKGGGRGVFANKDFKNGEIVEICPLISDKRDNFKNSIIRDYTFKNKFKDEEVIVFGLCSIYNHSDNNNIHHDQDNKDNMIFRAIRDIKKGEELYVNYGPNYWMSRSNNKN